MMPLFNNLFKFLYKATVSFVAFLSQGNSCAVMSKQLHIKMKHEKVQATVFILNQFKNETRQVLKNLVAANE